MGKEKKTLSDIITKEYTIHLHKHVFGTTFKKRAPKAIKVIRKFAEKQMKTKDVRLAPALNAAVWARGVKSVPHRIRVRLSRKRSDSDEGALYTFVEDVQVESFKGLGTLTVE